MRGFAIPTLLIILAILGVAFFGLALVTAPSHAPEGGVACTVEAKLCPDGSYVGRTGPSCEFAPCPGATSTATTTQNGAPVAGPGEHCGGNIMNAPVCAAGYHCQLVVPRPDTGGTCVADTPAGGGVACTMEAKQCPDGSYVGRTGPKCEFAACPTGGGFAEYHSGIKGTVLLGPTCPVMRNPPDPQCADKPYETSVYVYRAADPAHVFAVMQSSAEGQFQFSLPPGDYTLSAGGGSMLPRCSQVSATVGPTGYTVQDVSCDTGIR
jgi:hypothetical protein